MARKGKKEKKTADLRQIFGTLKTTLSGQALKDMAREGWEPCRDKPRRHRR